MGNRNEDNIDRIINVLSNTVHEAARLANLSLSSRKEEDKENENSNPQSQNLDKVNELIKKDTVYTRKKNICQKMKK